jgi:SUKH-3 immunity protein
MNHAIDILKGYMGAFSEKTLSLLYASGWSYNRNVDISNDLQTLRNEGYTIFPVIIDFLEQFSGLQIDIPNPIVPNIKRTLDFRISSAMRGIRQRTVDAYGDGLDRVLCLIGVDNDSIHFTMDGEGKVYGLYDRMILFIGNSDEEAIENCCVWHPSNPFPIIRDFRNEI